MKMFEMLDKLHDKNKEDNFYIPCNIPKIQTEEKYTDVKEYKRNYYLHNVEIYRQRNKAYRERKKEEKSNIKI